LLSAGKTFDHSGSPNSETPSKRSEVSQLQRWVPSYLCPTSSAGGSMPASGGQGTGFRHRWWRGPVRRAWNTVCISLHGLLKSEPLQCHNQAWQWYGVTDSPVSLLAEVACCLGGLRAPFCSAGTNGPATSHAVGKEIPACSLAWAPAGCWGYSGCKGWKGGAS